jgi:outer membrane lipoprotein-sorting protein
MKTSLIISTLCLCVSFFLSFSTKAQQQKKPSERSFAAEINKIKTIQATRNQKINQIQQPTESAAIPANSNATTNAGQNQTNNTNTSPEKKQAAPATKPSSGSMRPAKKPPVSRG